MSIIRHIDRYNEDAVICFDHEGDERLYLPLCGISRCLPDYRIEHAVSLNCVIEYVVSGRGTLFVDGRKFHPGAGDLYLLPRGCECRYFTDPVDRWVKIFFNIRGTLIDELLRIYTLERLRCFPTAGLESLFTECLAMMRSSTENAHECATLVVHKLIFGIAKARWPHPAAAENAARRTAAAIARKLEAAVFDAKFELGALAAEFGYSKSGLIRIFAAEYQMPPYRYLLKKKLSLASMMLLNTGRPIKEIAWELGFCDAFYFSNLFKRKFGVSPAVFRRQQSVRNDRREE